MQPAPAVSVECRVSPVWRAAALVVALAVLATSLGWATAAGGGRSWLLPAATLPLLLAGLWPLRPRPPQRLRWDGAQWWLTPSGARTELAGTLRPALDLGTHLLLRFDRREGRWHARRHWLALSRSATDGDWHGLRCALYWPGASGAVTAAADPSSRVNEHRL